MTDSGNDVQAAAIRQAAAVYLKNFVEKHWETYDDSVPSVINDADKATIRASIIEAVVAANEQIKKQLITIVRRLVRSDFPKTWTDVLERIVPLLQSEDINKITSALACFLEVAEWRGHNLKDVTDVIQGQVFPILLQIGQRFSQHIEEPAAQTILKHIFKAYFTAIQFKFSNWLMSGDTFMAWTGLTLQAIQSPVPAAVKALDREDAAENSYWKMKKWAFHIQNKIMSRYGNSKLETYANSENSEFARAYMSSMAIPVLNVYLAQINSYTEGNNPLTNRIICIISDFLEYSVRAKKTWDALRPQVMWIVQNFVFPHLCWSQQDAELYTEDPHEFIRTRMDPFDDFYSPPSSCVNWVIDLIKNRKKDTFMPILGFINETLSAAQSKPNDFTLQCRKDGALYLTGSLATLLLESKKTAGQMETFIAAFVIPELSSPHAHLRLRACWVLEQFDDLEFKVESNAISALSGILNCMTDGEFPVKVAACTALAGILENSAVIAALPPYLPKIVETILGLANEIELDSLSYVLEDIVTQFSEEMAPWAAQLCAQLRDTLLRSIDSASCTQSTDAEESGLFEDTDKMMAILGMLGTINTLVDSMSAKPETMSQIEEILLPLIFTMFQRKLMDVYEEVFSILDSLTYGQKKISPSMWQLLDSIFVVFQNCGSSYIPDMATTLDNYISYGRDQIVQNPKILSIFVEIIKTIMTDDDFVESDWVHGCNLMESLMLNCPGHLDSVLPLFLQLTLSKLADVREEDGKAACGVYAVSHRIYHIEVILNAINYNALMTIQELEKLGASAVFLTRWNEITNDKFLRVHDKKIIIVAVSSLLRSGLSFEQYPSSWQQGWPSILAHFLESVKTLPKAIEERQKLKEEAERGDADAPSRHDFDEDDDEDYDDASDAENEAIRKAVNLDSDGFVDEDWGSDDDDWEDTEDLEEDIYFETPLDSIDVASVVTGSIHAVAQAQPAAFQQMTSTLSHEHLATLQSIMQHSA